MQHNSSVFIWSRRGGGGPCMQGLDLFIFLYRLLSILIEITYQVALCK